MTQDTKVRLFGITIIAVLNLWITMAVGWAFYCSYASRHWPQTWGHITLSYVRPTESLGGTFWAPDVEYQYNVDGTLYTSNKLRFLVRSFTDRSAAASIPEAYPVGLMVRIAYDPKLPNRSVLQPGVPNSMWKEALVPALLWSGLLYFYYSIARPQRKLLFLKAGISGAAASV